MLLFSDTITNTFNKRTMLHTPAKNLFWGVPLYSNNFRKRINMEVRRPIPNTGYAGVFTNVCH